MLPLQDALPRLAERRAEADATGRWLADELSLLREAGAFGWIVPSQFGGAALPYADLLDHYRQVASASLAVALVLTQRDGACDLVARGQAEALKADRLPQYVSGRRFASIGIAQLTTSKGASQAKLRASESPGGITLDGYMPWVTGAAWCDDIITAAVLDDGRQVVACVERDDPGLRIEAPMKLLALDASHTSRVICDRTFIPAERLIRPPQPTALTGRAPVKGLTVSAAGMGLADAIAELIEQRSASSPAEVAAAVRPLLQHYRDVAGEFATAAASVADPDREFDAEAVRVRVNALVTRLAVALVNLSKGSGYLRGQPAEQFLREAMFFHVWSAPPGVQAGTLSALL